MSQNLEKKFSDQADECDRVKTIGFVKPGYGVSSITAGIILIRNGAGQLNSPVPGDNSEEAAGRETAGALKVCGGMIPGIIRIAQTETGTVHTTADVRKSKEYRKRINSLSLGVSGTPR